MEHKIHQLIHNINYATLITLAFFSRFWLDKPNWQTETIQVWYGDFTCKIIKKFMNQLWLLENLICFYIYHIRVHTFKIIE